MLRNASQLDALKYVIKWWINKPHIFQRNNKLIYARTMSVEKHYQYHTIKNMGDYKRIRQ